MKTSRNFIVFQMGIYFWGAEIHCVKEIVKNVSMEKCTNSFPGVVGMLNRDDSIIPVVDLHKMFYKECLPIYGEVFYVVFIFGGKLIAVPVNGVEQYCNVAEDCLSPVPMILKTGKRECVQQIMNFDGRLTLVLSLEGLFETLEQTTASMEMLPLQGMNTGEQAESSCLFQKALDNINALACQEESK